MAQVGTRPGHARWGLLLMGLCVAALVAACGSTAATAAPPTAAVPANLDGTSWRMTTYTTPEGRQFTVPMAVTPGITFTGGRVQGNLGCNQFSGPYTIDGGSITIGPVTSTLMGCEEPMASVEAAYGQALELVTDMRLEGDTLTLFAEGNRPALVYTRAPFEG